MKSSRILPDFPAPPRFPQHYKRSNDICFRTWRITTLFSMPLKSAGSALSDTFYVLSPPTVLENGWPPPKFPIKKSCSPAHCRPPQTKKAKCRRKDHTIQVCSVYKNRWARANIADRFKIVWIQTLPRTRSAAIGDSPKKWTPRMCI